MTEQTLTIGMPAPDFELLSDNGEPVKLSSLRGKKVILYFYPKDDTSGCTAQACGFRDSYPVIEAQNAVVLGISPDGVKAHTKFKTKHNLPFTLLVDDQHAVAEAYSVWVEKSMYGKKYMGIERSHFVIDETGILTSIARKVKPTESAKLALKELE
ncbi:MAG: thioredoxin-dependent thiol peroxidase [Candidatus Viridilinea halotolerans]|uniref:thioredoxin-dependent peroxiredoxin n=1 Tax=Candidatus Viridilinea halotolerans TaxID=2491704 RepID=A0A426TQ75_9CHLR|nr:MAG: thioredoxin-dependent thiol peroxidase [Candidatus Viridilinea halotolerans]